MKKLEISQMESLQGEGQGRKCLIDGFLTYVAVGIGFWGGGPIGAAAALVGGLYAGNANGYF